MKYLETSSFVKDFILFLQVTAGIDDGTYLTRSSTEDTHNRADNYSGKRGKNNCLIVSHHVSLNGTFMAVKAPNIAATPRGSDTTTMALQVGCSEKDTEGCYSYGCPY